MPLAFSLNRMNHLTIFHPKSCLKVKTFFGIIDSHDFQHSLQSQQHKM